MRSVRLLFAVSVAGLLAPTAVGQDNRVDLIVARATAAGRNGQHGKRVELLRYALRLAPKRADLVDKLSRACLRLGVQHMEAHLPARARDAFRDATRWNDKLVGAWLGYAQMSTELDEPKVAATALQRVLTLDATNFEALLALGKMRYDAHRYRSAVSLLERAVTVRPNDRVVATLLRKARKDGQIEGGFAQQSSRHFVVRYHGQRRGLERHVGDVLTFLERLHAELSDVLGGKPKRRIVVLLYTKTEFSKLKGTADWVKAFYDGKVRVPLDSWVTQRNRVQRTIRHELSHAFLHQASNALTPWFHEGFAQWFEGERVDEARDAFRSLPMLPGKALRQPFVGVQDVRLARLLYRQSLVLFVHLREVYGQPKILRFLDATRHAPDEESALREVYGKGLHALLEQAAARHGLVAPK